MFFTQCANHLNVASRWLYLKLTIHNFPAKKKKKVMWGQWPSRKSELLLSWDLSAPILNKASSLVAQRLKPLPAMWETWVRSLGREVPLEKEMETHSSILAWRIPWTEEPGGLQSTGLQRVGHNWATLLTYLLTYLLREMYDSMKGLVKDTTVSKSS